MAIIQLRAAAKIRANTTPRIEIIAYNGGLMTIEGFGPVVVNLKGMEIPASIPLIVDHDISVSQTSRMIFFVDPTTKVRRTIRLGRITKREVDGFKVRLERLISCKSSGEAPETYVAQWVATLDKRIAEKLAEWSFITTRSDIKNPSLLEFVDSYIKARTDTKPRTKLNHLQARGFVSAYFKSTARLADVTTLDAKQFRAWMISEGHAENYIRTQCKNIKMFFGAAVEGRLITENPFKGIPCKVQSVPERMKYISQADIALILEQAPDIEWRLVISLARWGGLRIPSEIAELKLTDINWETSRITIRVPKLEHIPGKGVRIIPLFPELLPVLRESAENAAEGAVYLLPRLRGDSKNLRTTFNKLVRRAGLTPWTRPFANLRSTRATELAEVFPLKTVAEWMGHDAQVSFDHYQQVRPEHWESAIKNPSPKAQQQAAELTRDDQQSKSRNPGISSDCGLLLLGAICTVPPRGFEPLLPP